MRQLAALLLLAALSMSSAPAFAVQPDEVLDDPALEARAREISKGLRCLVCQNQSIDDSDAPLARDLRILVRVRLKAGDNDRAVRDYVVARYGDYVLLKPPVKPITYVLWFGPAIIILIGLFGVVSFFRRRRSADAKGPAPLDDEERRRLDALLGDVSDDGAQ
jgi:cytochrome c-type biogenesis protein CcmH